MVSGPAMREQQGGNSGLYSGAFGEFLRQVLCRDGTVLPY